MKSFASFGFILTIGLRYIAADNSTRSSCESVLLHTVTDESLRLRPSMETGNTVRIQATIAALHGVDEMHNVVDLQIVVILNWTDDRLSWSLQDCELTQEVLPYDNFVWYPQIVLQNTFIDPISIDSWGTGPMFISNQGDVFKMLYRNVQIVCAIDLKHFPFDTSNCFLHIIVEGSTNVTSAATLNDLNHNHTKANNWELTDAILLVTNSRQAELGVWVKRESMFYMFTLYLPTMMLAPSPILVFIIPPDSGEKLGTCITTLLSFFVLAVSFFASIPTSNIIPNIGVIFIYLMVTAVIASPAAALILLLERRQSDRQEYEGAERRNDATLVRKLNSGFLCLHVVLNGIVPYVLLYMDVYGYESFWLFTEEVKREKFQTNSHLYL